MQLLTSNPHTSGCVHKDKYFWSFPHMSLNILSLGLPYSWRTLEFDPPLPLWSAIYSASWIHWRRRNWRIRKLYSMVSSVFLILESASVCPLEHIVFFPSLPLLYELAIERWRIEVVEAWVEDSNSPIRKSADKVCHYCISDLLIEISFFCPIHVHFECKYWIHWCV